MVWCKRGLLQTDMSYLNKKGIHPVTITDTDACIGCTNCALMCPDSVITIEKLEEQEKGI
jgi:2-oxoglutarate ferredoxin oxidoreductase subunit delta